MEQLKELLENFSKMIEVDVAGYELIMDNGIDVNTWIKHPAFIYTKPIPPSRFKRVSVSTEKKPNFFDDVTENVLQKEEKLLS